MKRSKSSGRWLDEHFKDFYVKQAKKEGYRSRAAYKLLEIQARDKLVQPGMTVVDLGSAPGGWAAVAKELVGEKGRVFAMDLLPMPPLPGVEFIQGDFTDPEILSRLLSLIDNRPVDLVMSDMAPNISGIAAIDQPRSMYLAELAFDFAQQVLKSGGTFLVKVFQGEGFDDFLKLLRASFNLIKIRKPKSSRARSNEIYLVGLGYNILK